MKIDRKYFDRSVEEIDRLRDVNRNLLIRVIELDHQLDGLLNGTEEN